MQTDITAAAPANEETPRIARRVLRRIAPAIVAAAMVVATVVVPVGKAEACSIFNPICWVDSAIGFIQDLLEDVIDLVTDIITLDPAGVFDDINDILETAVCGSVLPLDILGGDIAEAQFDSCQPGHPIEPVVQLQLASYFRSSFDSVTIHEECDFDDRNAITFGENIYFKKRDAAGNGYYPVCSVPEPTCACQAGLDNQGFTLLAHELTHVLQYRKLGFADFVCKYAIDCGLGPTISGGTTGVSCNFEQQAYIEQTLVYEDMRRDGDGVFTCPVGECDDEVHEWNIDNYKDHSCNAEILRCGLEGDDVPDYCASNDNCPDVYNPDQTDSDGDGRGDACDTCALGLNAFDDLDDDCVADAVDNCTCPDSEVALISAVCDSGVVPTGVFPSPTACFPVSGCRAYANTDQADFDGDGLGDACDPDDDNDGLLDTDEATLGTNPFDPDSDDDGLNDGDEVHLYGTNPLDADSDDDGLTDGQEVLTYHTNPLDPDTDHDGLNDLVEVTTGTDPLDPDTDDDGIPDGQDVEFLQSTIEGLPSTAFKGGGNKTAMLTQLDTIESLVAQGKIAQALSKLEDLRGRVDGCGALPDNGDWIVACTAQVQVRSYIDILITNLGG